MGQSPLCGPDNLKDGPGAVGGRAGHQTDIVQSGQLGHRGTSPIGPRLPCHLMGLGIEPHMLGALPRLEASLFRGVRKLDEKAETISKLLEVPVVAMGHCHRPKRRRMRHNHRHFYVNTGNFIAPEGPPRHRPDEPCVCPTTYVELHMPDIKTASPTLQRWCCVVDAPAPFEPERG